MTNMRLFRFWKNWGLISRLMLAVGVAIVAGGGVQTALLVAEGRADHSARLLREQTESLAFLAPLVAAALTLWAAWLTLAAESDADLPRALGGDDLPETQGGSLSRHLHVAHLALLVNGKCASKCRGGRV